MWTVWAHRPTRHGAQASYRQRATQRTRPKASPSVLARPTRVQSCSKTPHKSCRTKSVWPQGHSGPCNTPTRECMLQQQAGNTQLGAGTTAARAGLRTKRCQAPRGLDLRAAVPGGHIASSNRALRQLHGGPPAARSRRRRLREAQINIVATSPSTRHGRTSRSWLGHRDAPGHEEAHKTPGPPCQRAA